MKQTFEKYQRDIDSGQGRQVLVVHDGIVRQQRLEPHPGGHHSYHGDGNPEIVGKPIKSLRGWGFRKIRMSETQYNDFISADPYFDQA